jgi:hypothetical protein
MRREGSPGEGLSPLRCLSQSCRCSFLFLNRMLERAGGEFEATGAGRSLFSPTAGAMDPGSFIVTATKHTVREHTATTI